MPTHETGLSEGGQPYRDPDYWVILFDAVLAVIENLKLLIIGPIIAGAIAFVVVTVGVPKLYRSTALIGPIEGQMARTIKAQIQSPAVLGAIVQKFPAAIQSSTGRWRKLASRVSWDIAQGGDANGPSMYWLSMGDTDPARAQALLAATIDTLFDVSKPRPSQRAQLEILLKANQSEVADLNDVIAEMKKRPGVPSMKSDYFTPNLGDLFQERVRAISNIEDLKNKLTGLNRDLIVSPPTLPDEPIGPSKRNVVIKTMGGTFFVILLFALLRHAFQYAAVKPELATKLKRIESYMPPWRKR